MARGSRAGQDLFPRGPSDLLMAAEAGIEKKRNKRSEEEARDTKERRKRRGEFVQLFISFLIYGR